MKPREQQQPLLWTRYYRHYKGDIYQILDISLNNDRPVLYADTLQPVIVYRNIKTGITYVRSRDEFFGEVPAEYGLVHLRFLPIPDPNIVVVNNNDDDTTSSVDNSIESNNNNNNNNNNNS